jgi:hypothetical protein
LCPTQGQAVRSIALSLRVRQEGSSTDMGSVAGTGLMTGIGFDAGSLHAGLRAHAGPRVARS